MWFDEGVALQFDALVKRQLHERDLRLGLQQGQAFSFAELLAENGYPPQSRWPVFYGQSGSLVRWILTWESPEKLVHFVRQSREQDVNLALSETYGVAKLDDLYRQLPNDAVALDTNLPPKLSLPPSTPFRLVAK